MKQPEDRSTLELPGLSAPKRGRGRPRKPDALTPAQRAQRYRDKKLLDAALLKGSQRFNANLAKCMYRCPMTGSTWSGRGQKPYWVRVHLERGGYLADLHNPAYNHGRP